MMIWTDCRTDTVSPSQSSLSSLDRIYTRNVYTTQKRLQKIFVWREKFVGEDPFFLYLKG